MSFNTCPVGIATQNPELRKKFEGKPEHVVNFMYFIAEELREIMANLGFRTVDEMVGQVQKLNRNKTIEHYKILGLDLTPILHQVKVPDNVKLHNTEAQDHNLESTLDFKIINQAHPALFRKEKTVIDAKINNENRAFGAILSNEISKIYGSQGLPENTLKINFTGSAGQSFGAFATKGLTLSVNGNTNDYIGKGLSGAKLIVKVPDEATFIPEENIIIGNVAFYGATSGEAYMTGGIAVILGDVGRNFGAGMSGGIAYVYDKNKTFKKQCNSDGLNLLPIDLDEDINELKQLVTNHYNATQSPLAQRILENWEGELSKFVKVFPEEYKQALIRLEKEKSFVKLKL